MLRAVVALALLLAVATVSSASEKARASPSPGAVTTTAPEAEPEAPSESDGLRPEIPPIHVSLKDALFHNLHNKVVHFPLALGMAGALFLLLSYRRPHLLPAGRLLLVLAAASAVAAYFTGRAQEEEFEGGALASYLERHELMGKISAGLLALSAALSFVARARPWLWLLALAILAALSFTGLLGGILAHTPG